MAIDVVLLTNELLAAGIAISGCSEKGVVWDAENKEIQDLPEVKAVVQAHDPNAKIKEVTIEEKVAALWEMMVRNDDSLVNQLLSDKDG